MWHPDTPLVFCKLGYTWVYILFLIVALKHRLWAPNKNYQQSMFEQKKQIRQKFSSKKLSRIQPLKIDAYSIAILVYVRWNPNTFHSLVEDVTWIRRSSSSLLTCWSFSLQRYLQFASGESRGGGNRASLIFSTSYTWSSSHTATKINSYSVLSLGCSCLDPLLWTTVN